MTLREYADGILVRVKEERAIQQAILAKLTDETTRQEFASATHHLGDVESMVSQWNFDLHQHPEVIAALVRGAELFFGLAVKSRQRMEETVAQFGWTVQTRYF